MAMYLDSKLKPRLLDEIFSAVKLEVLDLNFAISTKKLVNLRELKLQIQSQSDAELLADVPSGVSRLSLVTSVTGEALPALLIRLTRLEALALFSSASADTDNKNSKPMKQVSSYMPGWDPIGTFAHLSHLRTLTLEALGSNNISAVELKAISALKTLESLTLFGNFAGLGSNLVEALEALPLLTALELRQNSREGGWRMDRNSSFAILKCLVSKSLRSTIGVQQQKEKGKGNGVPFKYLTLEYVLVDPDGYEELSKMTSLHSLKITVHSDNDPTPQQVLALRDALKYSDITIRKGHYLSQRRDPQPTGKK